VCVVETCGFRIRPLDTTNRSKRTEDEVVLHDQSKSGEKTSEHNSEAVAAANVQCHLCTILLGVCASRLSTRGSCCGSGIASKSVVDNLSSCTSCCTSWDIGGSRGSTACDVDSGGVLGSAWMIGSASTLAWCVAIARCHALVSVFLTFEVWERLGVFACIWAQSVPTDTLVGQCFLLRVSIEVSLLHRKSYRITIIGSSGRRFTRKLQAEQRT